MPFRHFFDTEAEVEVRATGRRFKGWVTRDSEGVLVLEKCSWSGLEYGEKVKITLKCPLASTEIHSDFIGAEEGIQLFSLPAAFLRGPGTGESKVRQRLLIGEIEMAGAKIKVPIEYISQDEIAYLCSHETYPGMDFRFSAEAFDLAVSFDVRVTEADKLPTDPPQWRCVAKIKQISRIDKHHWTKLISGELVAA